MAQTTRARLGDILRPRMASIAGLIEERLDRSGLGEWVGDRVVLTGGSSQLMGSGAFLANMLGRPVRVSAPDQAAALPAQIAVPAFSAVVGMVASAAAGEGLVAARPERNRLTQGYLGRVGQWLREGF